MVLFPAGFVLLLWAFRWNARALGEFRAPVETATDYRRGRSWRRRPGLVRGAYTFQIKAILAVLGLTTSVRAFWWWLGQGADQATGGRRATITDIADWFARQGLSPVGSVMTTVADYVSGHLGLLEPPSLLAHILIFGGALALGALLTNRENRTFTWVDPQTGRVRRRWEYISSAFVAGATGGVLLALLEVLIRRLNDGRQAELAATIVPPLGLLILVMGYVVEVALLGRVITEAEREWWARLASLMLVAAIAWAGAVATILYVPALFLYAGVPLRLALTSGWLGATALGVLTGRRAAASDARGGASLPVATIALLMPPIFLVGMLGAVSLLVSALVNVPPLVMPARGEEMSGVANYFEGVNGTSIWILLPWFIFMYVIFDWAQKKVDVNLFSLHSMYANRLIRCYLGASRAKPRWPERWSDGHDPAAGGGAPSLSPLIERMAPAQAAGGGALALSPALERMAPTPSGAGRAELERRIHRMTDEAEDLRLTMNRLRRDPQSDPRVIEELRLRWYKLSRLMRPDLLALIDVLNRELDLLGPGSRRRAELEHELSRRRTDLAGLDVGQRARDENPFTGFDPRDDIPLYDLRIGGSPAGDRIYWGPHLLINSELNLVAGEELALRDRKGESFVLTPLYCGAKSVGYARVTPESSENLTLGRAITISGAAVDPNMSTYQNSALTAFLTIFNARLGFWMQNPREPSWNAEPPLYGDRLVRELLGRTTNQDEFVHLSDGGHFDNLGLYELIRRRCRYIIAVDAGEDISASNDNLGILVRLARIDFGVRVELDTRPLEAEGPDELSRTHVVIGRIHYEDVDNGQVPGILVYVKITMTGDEPPDLQRYAKSDPRFPRQPTDFRQSFSEEQFESYRALGEHIALDVFGDAVARVTADHPDWNRPTNHDRYIQGNQRLMSALRGRWSSPPANHDDKYLESSRQWTQIQRDVRSDRKLRELSRDLYPELSAPDYQPPALTPERASAELHAVGQLLQVMEDAWIKLGLKGRSDIPTDRGWMNVFRRWTNTRAFHRAWPTLRSEFSPDFVKFCEAQLHMTTARQPWYMAVPADYTADPFLGPSIARLNQEFRREWPGEAWPGAGQPSRDIEAMIGRAAALTIQGVDAPPVWLLVQAPSGQDPAPESNDKFACGIIAACEAADDPEIPVDGERGGMKAFELFTWIRRPHRATGIGSRSVDPLLDQISRGLWAQYPRANYPKLVLRARFPKPDDRLSPDLELEMWKGFFALYDFRPVIGPTTETVLERRLWWPTGG
jgi:hypothetical protein